MAQNTQKHIIEPKEITDQEKKSEIVNLVKEFALEAQTKEKYSLIRQDTVTNKLARVSNKTGIKPEEFTTNGFIKTKSGSTDLTVIIKEYANVTLKPSTSKLLRALTINYTERGNKFVQIPLKEYMALTGVKDEKDARKNIKADLNALYNISCEASKEDKKGKKDFIAFRIIDAHGVKQGTVFANLTDSIVTHLQNCPIMPYSNNLFKIPNKYPYAFYLGDKITELIKLNMYDKKTKIIKPYFTASVKNLLQVCIENGMPTYEKVQKTCRRVEKRIIEPFESSLDACKDVFDWEYCNAKGTPLTDTQLTDRTYNEFVSRYIKIMPQKDYPRNGFNVKKCKQMRKKNNPTTQNKLKSRTN